MHALRPIALALLITIALSALSAPIAPPVAAQTIPYVDGPDLIAAIPLPFGYGTNMTVDEDANRVYIIANESISVLDGAANTMASVPTCPGPNHVRASAAADRVYAICSGALTVIDRASLAPLFDVSIGSYPQTVLLDEASGRMYMSHPEDDTVSIFDTGTNQVVRVLDLPDQPAVIGLMPAIGRMAVQANGQIQLLDLATFATITSFAVPQSAGVALSRFTNRIYVSQASRETVTVIDGLSAAVSSIPVPPGAGEVFVDSTHGRVYWMHVSEQTFTVLDEATGVTQSYHGSGYTPETGAVDERNGLFYAQPNFSPYLVELQPNGKTRAIPTRRTLPRPNIYNYGIAVNGLTRRAYVIDDRHQELLVIDTAGQSPPPNRVSQAVADQPVAIATNPLTGRTYVAGAGGLTVIADGAARSIPGLAGAESLAIDPVANRIFVGLAGNPAAELAILDGRTERVLATQAYQRAPRLQIVADPLTGQVLLASGDSMLAADGATGAVRGQSSLLGTTPGLALDAQRRRLYAAFPDTGVLVAYHPESAAILERLTLGGAPQAAAVNVATGDLFIGDRDAPVVWIVRGGDFSLPPRRIQLRGTGITALAANPQTNMAYAIMAERSRLAQINGATEQVFSMTTGGGPGALATDVVRDQIYVLNEQSPFVTVHASQSLTPWALVTSERTFPASRALTIDPLAGRLSVANTGDDELVSFDLADGRPAPLRVTVTPLPGQAPTVAAPTFNLAVQSDLAAATLGVYVQVDSRDGAWTRADRLADGSYQARLPQLAPGAHTLYAFALDAQSAGAAPGQPAALSAVAAHPFVVAPETIFPTTPLIDTFNRRNGPLGLRWVGEGLAGYGIRDQQAGVGAGGPIYWAQRFGDQQEAYLCLLKIDPDGEHGLLLKVENHKDVVNWRQGAIRVSYAPAAGQVQVTTYQPRLGWQVVATFAASFAPGDRFGARAGADGTVLVFRNGALIGRADTTATNGGFFAAGERGRVGVWFVNAEQARFDDFGGGTVVSR